MNEIERVIHLYEENRTVLSRALSKAGGHPETILSDEAFRKVMSTLAANNIRLDADYLGAPG